MWIVGFENDVWFLHFVLQITPQGRHTSWWKPGWSLFLRRRASTLSWTSEYTGPVEYWNDLEHNVLQVLAPQSGGKCQIPAPLWFSLFFNAQWDQVSTYCELVQKSIFRKLKCFPLLRKRWCCWVLTSPLLSSAIWSSCVLSFPLQCAVVQHRGEIKNDLWPEKGEAPG